MKLSGWGRYPSSDGPVRKADTESDILCAIAGESTLIARGMGRSYGDAALGTGATLLMERLNRLVAFDVESGVVTCESGVILADLLEAFVGRGWFVPVSPGTRFVTVGGMTACDVHGKNHHVAGSFGRYVETITLAMADGGIVCCSASQEPDLFRATIGGMGLTGVILQVSFRMIRVESPLIRRKTSRARTLTELLDQLEENANWTYSVAWMDAFGSHAGRGVVQLGEHGGEDGATPPWSGFKKRPIFIPFDLPSAALHPLGISAFNAFNYHSAQIFEDLVDLQDFFYPLDRIANWPRAYGARGFVQHQCVLPHEAAREGLAVLLDRMSKRGMGSFLAVLKAMGSQEAGLLSFAMRGYTLAMDFPASTETFALLDELDDVVSDFGGRLYLAKDACAHPKHIKQGYPRLPEFQRLRAIYDPDRKFQSLLSRRLGL